MAGSNYYGFTYAGTLTGPTYVPAAGNGYGAGMADAVQEAAYVSYPAAGAADGVAQYDYSQYQVMVSLVPQVKLPKP